MAGGSSSIFNFGIGGKESGVNRVPDRRHSHRNIAEPEGRFKEVLEGRHPTKELDDKVRQIENEELGPRGKWDRQ